MVKSTTVKTTVKKSQSRPNQRARSTIRKAAEAHKPIHVKPETDEQIESRIADRFAIMDELVQGVINREHRSVIISGPPGVGKTFTVHKRLMEYDPNAKRHAVDHGYVRPTGIYKRFFEFRDAGGLVVFDDADSIFNDSDGLNLLKAATDTSLERHMSWGSEYDFGTINGVKVPRQFEFCGGSIIITNVDFDAVIESGTRQAPHLEALMSRAHYVDLGMKTRRDAMIWVRHVVRADAVLTGDETGLSEEQSEEVLQFMVDNSERLRMVSIREAKKIGGLVKSMGPDRWRRMAEMTCLVQVRT
jgi:hypothetical protein